MAPHATATEDNWSAEYETARRQKLFRNPPRDRSAYPALAAAVEPHISSFNAILERGGLLEHALRDIGTKVFLDGRAPSSAAAAAAAADGLDIPRRNRLSVRVRDVFLERPALPPSNKFVVHNREILPAECRERHVSYRGKLRARLEWRVNDGDWKESVRELGQVPIMVMSSRCHLEGKTPHELVAAKEESEEQGGYFVVNGIEKLIRLLVVNRRNYPMAIKRSAFRKRGSTYTEYGVLIRSVRPDQTSQSNCLHYLSDGNVIFRFSWRKNEFLVPVVELFKALVETSDREIFEGIVGSASSPGIGDKQFVVDRVELLLRTFKDYGIQAKSKCRAHLGRNFKVVLNIPDDMPDEEAGDEFLRKVVLPHLGSYDVRESNDADKFRMLLFMTRKLYSLVEGECTAESPDLVQNQEGLLGGFLYGMILKERIEEWLLSFRMWATEWSRSNDYLPFTSPEFQRDFLPKVVRKTNENIGQLLEYFLSTGNLVSPSGLDLQQVSGFTIVAEKLNFLRFISHFRSLHRGSFFASLKTTDVRKLMPESWGFLCPVHTPDGAPCGLLNHLAHKCKLATRDSDASTVPGVVAQFGTEQSSKARLDDSVVVQLDGRVLGYCSPKQAGRLSESLRYWKVNGEHGIPLDMEVGYVPNSNGGQYPGVYLFSQAARFYRPVKYLPLEKLDYVGPFEQPYMSIACTEPEIVAGDSTHVEFDPTHILSILANMTPFSDFNQSPRNMYQCQMGKQTMGTPGAALRYRTDNKTYRLQTGQTPIVRPPLHNEYGFDNFPNGTNAVVAVISYTGYDMDDAMILNKSAHERGFAHGTIYKTKKYDIDGAAPAGRGGARSARNVSKLFGFAPGGLVKQAWREKLEDDGIVAIGTELRRGDPIAAFHAVSYDHATGAYAGADQRTQFLRYADDEPGFVEEVRILGAESGAEPAQSLSVKFRVPRPPSIGDKFSSRHGQKGVCSQRWPAADMPFTESGIVPDVIINPHAFPSRMTIGMFVESLAGKAGALHGLAQDGSPFRFDDAPGATAADYFGAQLRAAGFAAAGSEPMYSGVTGCELAADVFVGVVYYQRLRHMVWDKFQARATGPVDRLTGQPVKGRARGGGVRVGEMERDALLAHGAAALLQDRLLNCSDYARAALCRACGSFLGAGPPAAVGRAGRRRDPRAGGRARRAGKLVGGGAGGLGLRCRRCAVPATGAEPSAEVWEDGAGVRWTGGTDVAVVAVPGVLRYLDVELASVGVKMRFDVEP